MLVTSRLIAMIAMNFNFSRKRVAILNIEHCFPDYTALQRQKLLLDHFQNVVMGFFEAGMTWWWPKWRLTNIFTVKGYENIKKHEGEPILALAGHFTNLELGGAALAISYGGKAMYKKNKNVLFEWIQVMGRTRFQDRKNSSRPRSENALEKNDLKKIIRYLKKGGTVWYGPDQDMGADRSVFVPFMGQTAATITATSKIVKMVNATIIPATQVRTAKGYDIIIFPALENFPVDDERAAAIIVNETIESFVKLQPAAYFWVHRRFKTQPNNESFY